ncbi:MAG: hypothetical protein HRT35_17250, partial [Algicola sp.]|nr:hypothetical protein [Algicola sp.]
MLDWNRFESLTGLPANNFEKLCRSIVRRQFGSLGILRELKNQPGVEFHITLNKDSSQFGIKDETVGWQCKWFEYRANGELTSSAKSQIQDSLDKTVKHLPSMSHWILWTHKTLSKVDQNWYYGLASSLGFKLYLWNADDIDSFLAGTSLELRNSYFGELALTRQILEQQHAEAVAPISSRWMKLTHQQTKEEREIRQSLGEPAAFDRFKSICSRLSKAKNAIVEVVDTADYCPWAAELKRFIGTCETVVGYADFFQSPVGAGDIDKIAAMVEASKTLLSVMIYKLMSKLRKFNLPLAIPVTNAVAYIKDTNAILQTVHESVTRSFIAILADAGGGKTQLAAALTAPQDNRAAGILLLGRDLRKGCTLDKLAAKYSFYGKAVESFNAILAALDAAAYRDNCRLPIVIDGLNEAEDPRDWKYLLAPIIERLKHYPNVLLVCTLRTGEKKRANSDSFSVTEGSREEFAKMALPENCHTLISKGFDGLTQQAVEAYFHHFKIVADPQLAPIDFFSHPLNLRIFCEVTNRKAQAPVHVTSFPASISTLFEKQIDHVAVRIAELPNLHRVYKKEDVLRAIFEFGVLLWECNTRSVCEDEFLDKVSLRGQNWDESFVNLLAQEGILFRDSAEQPHAYILTPVYDRLGGYLIASMLLHSHRGEAFERFVKQEDSIDAIFGGRE